MSERVVTVIIGSVFGIIGGVVVRLIIAAVRHFRK